MIYFTKGYLQWLLISTVLQLCADSTKEISKDESGVVIVDKDYIWKETLTDGVTPYKHYVYVQRTLNMEEPQCDERIKDAKIYYQFYRR